MGLVLLHALLIPSDLDCSVSDLRRHHALGRFGVGLEEAVVAREDEIVVGGEKVVCVATCDIGQGVGKARGAPKHGNIHLGVVGAFTTEVLVGLGVLVGNGIFGEEFVEEMGAGVVVGLIIVILS